MQYTVNDFSMPPRSFGKQGKDIFIDGMSFSPDGTQLATLYRDSTLRIWNMSDLDLVVSRQLEEHISGIAWNPLGNSIAAMASNSVMLLDPSTLESLSTISSVATNFFGHMAFNPQGTILVVPNEFDYIDLWDVSGKDTHSIGVPKVKDVFEDITSIAFDTNGDLLALGTCNSGGPATMAQSGYMGLVPRCLPLHPCHRIPPNPQEHPPQLCCLGRSCS